MALAKYPSRLVLPLLPQPYPTLLNYLCQRFNKIDENIWRQRFNDKKILDQQQRPLTLADPYVPQQTIYYFREVVDEQQIPFKEEIIYQDEELLVVDKPHFLPVTPGGRFVEQCLVYRLRQATGIDDLVPLHRLDRHTAGLVMFAIKRESRCRYAELFSQHRIKKTYTAVAYYDGNCRAGEDVAGQSVWHVENRIGNAEPWFVRQVVAGVVNARSTLKLQRVITGSATEDSATDGVKLAEFELQPHTGKTHQLRLHMSGAGFPIVNDGYYPTLQPQQADDYSKPLQLLAQRLVFTDPVTGLKHKFVSKGKLLLSPT